MNLQIRKATQDDYSDICALVNHELGYPDVDVRELSARLDMMAQDSNYCTFVALLDDKVAGFIGTAQGITFEANSGQMRIIALAVSGDYHKKGIGSALLKHAEAYAQSKGVTWLALNSGFRRVEAHMFYENNGYIKKQYGFSKYIL